MRKSRTFAAVLVILILAAGDSSASLVGNAWGRCKAALEWKKTLGGLDAICRWGDLGVIRPACPVPATFLTIVAGAAVESLSERLDDNITFPAVSSLLCCLLLT